MFEVGQRVVCVDDSVYPGRKWAPGCAVRRGAIYTIAENNVTNFITGRHDCVLLVEKRNILNGAYRADRFEPLPKKTTSIEIFTRMLTPREKVNG